MGHLVTNIDHATIGSADADGVKSIGITTENDPPLEPRHTSFYIRPYLTRDEANTVSEAASLNATMAERIADQEKANQEIELLREQLEGRMKYRDSLCVELDAIDRAIVEDKHKLAAISQKDIVRRSSDSLQKRAYYERIQDIREMEKRYGEPIIIDSRRMRADQKKLEPTKNEPSLADLTKELFVERETLRFRTKLENIVADKPLHTASHATLDVAIDLSLIDCDRVDDGWD